MRTQSAPPSEIASTMASESRLRPQLPWQARMQRHADKIAQVLEFLRTEIYTTTPIVQELLGVAATPARLTLLSMQELGMVTRHKLRREESNGFLHDLWGITAEGQVLAFPLEPGFRPAERWFRPGDVRPTLLQHTIQLQRARIAATRAGWRDWVPGIAMGRLRAGYIRPDATVLSPDSQLWAIELERTLKATARYERILFERLAAIKAGQFDRCVWICTDRVHAERLANVITTFQYVRHPKTGVRYAIHPANHHRQLSFLRLEQWPPAIATESRAASAHGGHA